MVMHDDILDRLNDVGVDSTESAGLPMDGGLLGVHLT